MDIVLDGGPFDGRGTHAEARVGRLNLPRLVREDEEPIYHVDCRTGEQVRSDFAQEVYARTAETDARGRAVFRHEGRE